ncbi:WXG100 family type VII secretion target [Streptosporangium sp. NPDC048047]|uniref:WXG100 family type VII secretion target n=1 Tax=Streptosporangium sp. NPDC048047 TaxID=3155748 RepID=UPI003434680C
MGSETKVLLIRSYSAVPDAGTVSAGKSEIQRLLNDTSATAVNDAGFAYGKAAGTIDTVCGALQRNAAELSRVWGGDAAKEVQKALQMLHATGAELSSKMNQMSTTLRLYGGEYLPQAIAKIEKIPDPKLPTPTPGPSPSPGGAPRATSSPSPTATPTPTTTPAPSATPPGETILTPEEADRAAREVLKELNEKIVDLYTSYVPPHVSYELPVVELPGGPGDYRTTRYSDGSPNNGSIFSGNGSGGGYDPSGSSWPGGSGGSGSSGSGSGSHGSGGSGSDGSGSGGNGGNGGGSGSGGSGSDGSGSGGTGTDGSGSHAPGDTGTNAPGANDPGGNGAGANGPGANGPGRDGDGTVPSVIGGENGSRYDRTTEMASFNPQTPPNTVSPYNSFGHPNPVIGNTVTPNPNVTAFPNVTTNVPPILGGPGTGNGPGSGFGSGNGSGWGSNPNGVTSAVLSRGTTGGPGMIPPFMGGGGAEGEQEERSSGIPISEVDDVWGSAEGGGPSLLC